MRTSVKLLLVVAAVAGYARYVAVSVHEQDAEAALNPHVKPDSVERALHDSLATADTTAAHTTKVLAEYESITRAAKGAAIRRLSNAQLAVLLDNSAALDGALGRAEWRVRAQGEIARRAGSVKGDRQMNPSADAKCAADMERFHGVSGDPERTTTYDSDDFHSIQWSYNNGALSYTFAWSDGQPGCHLSVFNSQD
jgi:hypothetical protein